MITVCWAAKGGSGTTVFVAAAAASSASDTLLIDLDGDVPAVLGLAEPEGPGVFDWLCSTASVDRLGALEHRVGPHLRFVSRGRLADVAADRWVEFSRHLADDDRHVIVDAGSRVPPAPLLAATDRALLVTRPCYLALRRAVADGVVPSGIVLVREPGRAMRAADVEASIGAPVVATLLLDPAVARACDSGLLASRLPGAMRRQLAVAS